MSRERTVGPLWSLNEEQRWDQMPSRLAEERRWLANLKQSGVLIPCKMKVWIEIVTHDDDGVLIDPPRILLPDGGMVKPYAGANGWMFNVDVDRLEQEYRSEHEG